MEYEKYKELRDSEIIHLILVDDRSEIIRKEFL
jgi:hypothetical protein